MIGLPETWGLFTALVLSTQAVGAARQDRASAEPNVVLIIADDQGWDDYGFMGHPDIRTPNLDRLARRSLVFARGYVVAPLCRPSLASIATGLHPHQHGVVANDVDPERRAESDRPVSRAFHEHPSLVRLLTDKGYLAHQSGKWWEGSHVAGGFSHGMTHGDSRKGGRHGDVGLRIGRDGLEPVTHFVNHAVAEGAPFLLWYAPFMPHTPHDPPAAILEKYEVPGRPRNVARYYAMCEWVDQTCGELLGHLVERGLMDNTIVVYICDNGWAPLDPEADNPPGWWPAFAPRSKGSPFERGIRTPIMIAWPDRVKPENSPDLASSVDLMPTILNACGVEPPPDLSGIDLLDASARARRDTLFGASYSIHNMTPGDAGSTLQYRWCIWGDWKLLLRSHGRDTTRYKTVHAWDRVPARLWNLRDDPHEKVNLVAERPETAERLRARIAAWYPARGPSGDTVAADLFDFRMRPADGLQLVGETRHVLIAESDAENQWKFEEGVLTASPAWDSVVTPEPYEDFRMHLEFNVNDAQGAKHEANGNSGIYIQQRYELQILNSYGIAEADYQTSDCGSLYRLKKPDRLTCKPAGEWQSFDILFRAARFDADRKVENARVTVYQNQQLIHDNVSIERKTGAGKSEGPAALPIKLQGHHNEVRFRNVWIQRLRLEEMPASPEDGLRAR